MTGPEWSDEVEAANLHREARGLERVAINASLRYHPLVVEGVMVELLLARRPSHITTDMEPHMLAVANNLARVVKALTQKKKKVPTVTAVQGPATPFQRSEAGPRAATQGSTAAVGQGDVGMVDWGDGELGSEEPDWVGDGAVGDVGQELPEGGTVRYIQYASVLRLFLLQPLEAWEALQARNPSQEALQALRVWLRRRSIADAATTVASVARQLKGGGSPAVGGSSSAHMAATPVCDAARAIWAAVSNALRSLQQADISLPPVLAKLLKSIWFTHSGN
jgi:hypothetical protein